MKKICVLAGALLVFFVCGTALAEEKISVANNNPGAPPLMTLDAAGNLYVLHYGNDEFLYIIKNKKIIGKLKKDGAQGSFIWLGFPDGKPALIWRPKFSDTGAKFLYYQKADENMQIFDKEIILNTAQDALLPVKVEQGENALYVLWTDERKPPVSLFMNYSTDAGRTFRSEDIPVAPGYASSLGKLLLDGKKLFLFFVGRKGEENTGIYVKESADGTQWSSEVSLASYEDWVPAAIEGVTTPDGPVVFWAGARGIGYAYTDPERKWHSQFIEQTRDMDVNRIEVKRDKNGGIYLLTSYKKTGVENAKPSVFFFKSNDNGRTWSEPVRVNHNQYENTSSWFPAMHITDDGTVIVVWQDHRLIRGNIYMNYSKDGGKTWLTEDINLDDEPGKHNDYYPYITGDKDKINVLIPRYKDDSLSTNEIDLYLKEVRIHE